MTHDTHVPNSKFYMLRCVVAMAHADGIVTDDERAYISAITNRIPLTDEQRSRLERDLDEQQDIFELFRHINDPRFRSQVLYFARIMAHKDGVLSPEEDDLLEKIHAITVEGLDIETIRAEARKVTATEMLVHDIKMQDNRPQKHGHFIPYFQWLDEILLYFGIDLMRD